MMSIILPSCNEAMTWIEGDDNDSLTELVRAASNNTLVFKTVRNYANTISNEARWLPII